MNRSYGVIASLVGLICLLCGTFACVEEGVENWPGFRGPNGQGISSAATLPLSWNETENIGWRVAIPGAGWSSPVVWQDKVFVTTATDSGVSCRVLALSLSDGEVLWNMKLFEQEPGHMHRKNSYATPTPVIDGQSVFVVFGDGSIAAVDFSGKLLWQNRDFKHYSHHGLGASPVLYEDLLIMTYDGSSPGPDKKVGWQTPWEKALIVALDKTSGEVRWLGKRGQSRIAHVTPTIMTVDSKTQLISGAGDVVQGFDIRTGDRLWSVPNSGEGVVPSVVQGDGLVYTSSGFGDPAIRATRPGTEDDAEIIWEQKQGVPRIPSFVYQKPYLYTISENGIAMCLQGGTGEIVWRDRVGGKHASSPVLANNKIYFLDEDAQTTVIEAGPEFRVVAKNSLSGKCQASMAVADGRILIRTDKELFCIQ